MCYNAITGSAPSYLFEVLHLYSPSRSLRPRPVISKDSYCVFIKNVVICICGIYAITHFQESRMPIDVFEGESYVVG